MDITFDGTTLTIVSYELPLVSKKRPKFNRSGVAYNPSNYTNWKLYVAQDVYKALGHRPLLFPKHLPLQLVIHAYTGRGDADNLAGGLMDALIGVVYHDDKQIKHLSSTVHPRNKKGLQFTAVIRGFNPEEALQYARETEL